MAKKLPPPPRPGEPGFHDWMLLFYQFVTGGTSEVATSHSALADLNTSGYSHLTGDQKTDLTDGGSSSLHYHAADRDRANHTGTQPASTISDLSSLVQSLVGNHAALGGLEWASSGHIATASTIPGFNSSGIAEELTRTGTGTVVAMSASPTFTGTVSVAAVAGSGVYTFNNTQYIAWKNAAGVATVTLQKFSDDHTYFDNYDGNIVFRTKEGASVANALTLAATSQDATFAGNVFDAGELVVGATSGSPSAATINTHISLGTQWGAAGGGYILAGGSADLRFGTWTGTLGSESYAQRMALTATALTPSVPILAGDGTATAPSYSFSSSGNTDNGMYLSASNTVAIAAAGALAASFSSSGIADAKGEVRTIVQNSQSAAYTLVLTDAGKHILHPSADTTARTWTIPANSSVAFPVGTAVTFINQNSAGVITIAITTDTMRLAGAGTTGSRSLAANGVATAVKVTTTEWIISGTGLS